MRKHIVNCKIEGTTEQDISKIQYETNEAYIEKIRNTLMGADISKSEKVFLICRLQEKLKNNLNLTKD